ncbi:MAG: caspase family protein [Pseudomonadota bacterium]
MAVAADRVALVIGNSAYSAGQPLKNANNDAMDIARSLQELNFDVVVLKDVGFKAMIEALGRFLQSAPKYQVRLIYYAGHGLQLKEKNYLVPVDADIKTVTDVNQQAVRFDDVMDKLARIEGGTNILILDACRNNPFISNFAFGADGRRIQLRGPSSPISPGLANLHEARVGTFVAFAAQPGYPAKEDLSGRNSIYAKHILKHIHTPNLRIGEMFERVRKGVKDETVGQQLPMEQTTLTGPFCFNATKQASCE